MELAVFSDLKENGFHDRMKRMGLPMFLATRVLQKLAVLVESGSGPKIP